MYRYGTKFPTYFKYNLSDLWHHQAKINEKVFAEFEPCLLSQAIQNFTYVTIQQ
jgi:hypothetical protein